MNFLDNRCIISLNNKDNGEKVESINIKKNTKIKLVKKYRDHNYFKNIWIKLVKNIGDHKQYKYIKIKLEINI